MTTQFTHHASYRLKHCSLTLLVTASVALPAVQCLANDVILGEDYGEDVQLALLEDQAQFAALMDILEEETEIATKTKMNADFVPGMVTVLQSDQLRSLGLETVGEALNTVAGFNVFEGNFGEALTVVRGFGTTLDANNLKLMLNGVSVNSAVNGDLKGLYMLPMESVERIEVIRGPGSAIHGAFAFSGVVNVITRAREGEVFLKTGSAKHWLTAVNVANEAEPNKLHSSLNLSAWDRDNSGRISYVDNHAPLGFGHAPGPTHDQMSGRSAIWNLSYQGYNLKTQYVRVEKGVTFGAPSYTPYDLAPMVESVFSVSFDKVWSITDTLDTSLMLSGRDNKRRNAAFLGVPVGARAPGLDGVVEVESYVRDGYADSSYKADWQWRWNPVQAHRILLGLSYEYMQVDEAFMENVRPNAVRLPALPGRTPVDPEADRSLGGILLQDQWQLTSGLELTFGVRYDHYDDWGDNLSPRAAAIWRVADGHILKFQYAEAFRPPTLEESYGGALPGGSPAPDLDAETIDSQELAYIYRGNIGVFRTTLFRTHVEDLIEFVIIPGRMPALLNRGELNSYGVEFEWQQRINHTWDILANVSYVHTKDEMTDEEVVGAVDWMGNLGVTWQTLPQVEQGALLQYRGQQLGYNVRLRLPPDRTLPEYWTLNYSVAWQPLTQYPGFKVSGTVKNVFDEEYAVVSAGPTYPLGLPQLGRTWWAELSYQF